MSKTWLVIALALGLAPGMAEAKRKWKTVDVAGAFCGDGAVYQVFVSQGESSRVTLELMGGGACWSFATCFGPKPSAWLHRVPMVPESGGLVSDDPKQSVAAGDTFVYFPYCTGDVHLGSHLASYGGVFQVHHAGRQNFQRALDVLERKGLIDLRAASRVILYGHSAGALGAFYHVLDVETRLGAATNRVLLADSPGLHFGPKFWSKFPKEFLQDFTDAFERARQPLDTSRGNIAALVPAVCHLLPAWRVGVLQSSRDAVMSTLFGDISPDEHEKLVYGSEGLDALTRDPADNCAAWLPKSSQHTFLPWASSSKLKTSDGLSAMDFARETVEARGGSNHPNHR
jgi:hypothetical protein